jgi:hypothetical protein
MKAAKAEHRQQSRSAIHWQRVEGLPISMAHHLLATVKRRRHNGHASPHT